MSTQIPDLNLPTSVAGAWYLVTCGGEVYDGRIYKGCDLATAYLDFCFGGKSPDAEDVEGIANDIQDPDQWYVVDGKWCHWKSGLEDGTIEFHLITEFPWLGTVAKQLIEIENLKRERGLLYAHIERFLGLMDSGYLEASVDGALRVNHCAHQARATLAARQP